MEKKLVERKAEINVLLKSMGKAKERWQEASVKACQENLENTRTFLPTMQKMFLNRFEVQDYYSKDSETKYEFSFKVENGASLLIDVQNKKFQSYSVTGCSDHNINPTDLKIVEYFYSDTSILLGFFGDSEKIESFYELAKSFKKANCGDFVNSGLNEYQLQQELVQIEQQEKIEKLDLKEGSIIQYYHEGKKRYDHSVWQIVRIKKITPKKFTYVQYSIGDKKWLDADGKDWYDTKATIDYNKIKELDENQKTFFCKN